jgi:hypothetical protein
MADDDDAALSLVPDASSLSWNTATGPATLGEAAYLIFPCMQEIDHTKDP